MVLPTKTTVKIMSDKTDDTVQDPAPRAQEQVPPTPPKFPARPMGRRGPPPPEPTDDAEDPLDAQAARLAAQEAQEERDKAALARKAALAAQHGGSKPTAPVNGAPNSETPAPAANGASNTQIAQQMRRQHGGNALNVAAAAVGDNVVSLRGESGSAPGAGGQAFTATATGGADDDKPGVTTPMNPQAEAAQRQADQERNRLEQQQAAAEADRIAREEALARAQVAHGEAVNNDVDMLNNRLAAFNEAHDEKVQGLQAIIDDPSRSDMERHAATVHLAALTEHHKEALQAFEEERYRLHAAAASRQAALAEQMAHGGGGEKHKTSALAALFAGLGAGRHSRMPAAAAGELPARLRQIEQRHTALTATHEQRLRNFLNAGDELNQATTAAANRMSQSTERFLATTEGRSLYSAISALAATSGRSSDAVMRQFAGLTPVEPGLKEGIAHLRRSHKETIGKSTNPDIVGMRDAHKETIADLKRAEKAGRKADKTLAAMLADHPNKAAIDPDRVKTWLEDSVKPLTEAGAFDPADVDGEIAKRTKRLQAIIAEAVERLFNALGRMFRRGQAAAPEAAPQEAAAPAPAP